MDVQSEPERAKRAYDDRASRERLWFKDEKGVVHPVFDESDVEVFIALAHLRALVEVAARDSALLTPENARSSSDRHLIEKGHRLRFGCCRREETSA